MDFGLTGKLNEYYLGNIYQQSKAASKGEGVSFQDIISAKAAEKASGRTNVTGMSFKDMWQARFPGGKYHVFDASKIPMGVWCRNDFPVEKFFQDEVDESVLDWKPTGTEPDMADASVQRRLDSVLGQYVINVPPELEEKMKNNPAIAKKIMKNIDELFAWNGHPVPGRINGGVICLDENGEVARWNLISGGGGITQSSSEMVEAYYRRMEKRAEYEKAVEKNVIKRKLQSAEKAGAERVDAYREYLQSRYGGVTIKSAGKDQKSMDSIGAGTSGTGNVIIAPNILEQMANDSEKAAYYEEKIQNYFRSLPRYQAELSAMGHEIHSSGIVIHPDGTVTHYISGDLKPEVRAKIEARIKAEDEEKAKRKRKYRELSEEAAEKRRLLMKQYNQRRIKAEALQNQLYDTYNLYIVGQSQAVTPAVAAYQNTVSTFSRSVIKNV